jgi:hypothetical protein
MSLTPFFSSLLVSSFCILARKAVEEIEDRGAHLKIEGLDLMKHSRRLVTFMVESYTWIPSHDQCGMLRPFGTSSADWWYRFIVVVVAQAK